MLQGLFVISNVLGLLFYSLLITADVSVTQNLPESIAPGDEIVVEVTINKGDLSEFAQLKIDIPEGLTPSSKDNKGASFTFKEGTARWVWYSLPTDPQFVMKYKLKADDNASGVKDITGKFSYVVDNNPQSLLIPEHSITIGDEAPTSSGSTVSDGGTLDLDAVENPVTNANAEVFYSRFIKDEGNGNFLVTVTVQKNQVTGFGRALDNVPEGFTASAVETKGAIFSFVDQQAKFIWTELPAIDKFDIVYRMKADPGVRGDFTITGEFSYIVEETEDIKDAPSGPSEFSVGEETLAATGGDGSSTGSGNDGSTASTGGDGSSTGTGNDGSTASTGGDGSSNGSGNDGSTASAGGDGSSTGTGNDGSTASTGGDGSSTGSGNDGSTASTGGDGSSTGSGNDGSTAATGGDGSSTGSGNDGSTASTGGDGSSTGSGNDGSTASTGGDGSSTGSGNDGSTASTGGDGSSTGSGNDGSTASTGGDGSSTGSGNDGSTASTGGDGSSTGSGDDGSTAATGGDGSSTGSGNSGSERTGDAGAEITCSRVITKQSDDEFLVEVTIEKGDVNGFARLRESIPAGFKATEVNSKGGRFTYIDNAVKIVWTMLPSDETMVISYEIQAEGDISGTFDINGEMSYVVNDERMKTSFGPTSFEITPPALASTGGDGSSNGSGNDGSTASTGGDGSSTGSGNDGSTASTGGDGSSTGTGNDGSTASTSGDGSSTGSGNDGSTASTGGDGSSTGSGNDGSTASAGGDGSSTGSGNDGSSASTGGDGSSTGSGNDGSTASTGGDGSSTGTGNDGSTAATGGDGSSTGSGNDGSTASTGGDGSSTSSGNDGSTASTGGSNAGSGSDNGTGGVVPISSPEQGITYKVQILAAHRVVENNYFARKYDFNGTVNLENHEGWTKYTVGSFKVYKAARDRREEINEGGHNFPGPFVAAYNDGNRITVQEALMISNQQWYQ